MPKRTFSVPAAIVDMSADLSSSPAASGNGTKKANGNKRVDQPEKEVEKKVDQPEREVEKKVDQPEREVEKKVDQPEKEVEKKVDRPSYVIPAAKGKGFANPAVVEDVIRQLLPPFLSRGKK